MVSAAHPGLSSWYGNKIAAGYALDPVQKRRIPAHEILLSHAFQIMRRYRGSQEIDDWRVWAFSEITGVSSKIMILMLPILLPAETRYLPG